MIILLLWLFVAEQGFEKLLKRGVKRGNTARRNFVTCTSTSESSSSSSSSSSISIREVLGYLGT